MMKLTIKNMVCNHCVEAVRRTLTGLGYEVESVELGRAVIANDSMSDTQLHELSESLQNVGFELITDPGKDLVESIKREVIAMVRNDEAPESKASDYLAERLHRDYRTLSRIFSEYEGRTIETYVILQKIERVKELLLDGQLTVSEIAYRTGYSSVAHLSRQFKSITGLTPTEFRENGHRLPLNEV